MYTANMYRNTDKLCSRRIELKYYYVILKSVREIKSWLPLGVSSKLRPLVRRK